MMVLKNGKWVLRPSFEDQVIELEAEVARLRTLLGNYVQAWDSHQTRPTNWEYAAQFAWAAREALAQPSEGEAS